MQGQPLLLIYSMRKMDFIKKVQGIQESRMMFIKCHIINDIPFEKNNKDHCS